MLTLGINFGATAFGKTLKDGGACLVHDGHVIAAIAEERLSRRKADGGYEESIPYVLGVAGITGSDVDLVVASTCCEPPPTQDRLDSLSQAFGFRRSVAMPSHHLSHAYSAFYPSPFERALIVVLDGGGNVFSPMSPQNNQWWQFPREQHSYYLGDGAIIQPIDRDFFEPLEAGFGEIYRAFTYYVGWHSSRYAGKTMALAGYGDPTRIQDLPLFRVDGERLRSVFSNEPVHPIHMIDQTMGLTRYGILPRLADAPIEKSHEDLARYVQDQMENAMIQLVRRLVARTGCRSLCLAGGVALNCVMNQAVLRQSGIDAVFIQPGANDQGQCLGNALFGQHQLGYKRRPQVRFRPYLGRSYAVSEEDVQRLVLGAPCVTIERAHESSAVAARLIADGQVIGWFQGGSEFGPRSLGHRSILAHAGHTWVLPRLNRIKGRDAFMPYAPAVMMEDAPDLFDMTQPSPHMLLAPRVRASKRGVIPAVTHVDGTARVQTVSADDDTRFYGLLRYMKAASGIPVVLNTSFNREFEPIVETPADAVDCFLHTELDALVIEDFVVRKQSKREGDRVDDQ